MMSTMYISYILSYAPLYMWCTMRSYYRILIYSVLPGTLDEYVPDLPEYPYHIPMTHNLYDDIRHLYYLQHYKFVQLQQNVVYWIHSTFNSPETFGICPDDRNWYLAYLWVPGLIFIMVATLSLFKNIFAIINQYHVRDTISSILHMFNGVTIPPETYRSAFLNLEMITPQKVTGHSHPVSASNRNADSMTIRKYANLIGREPYFVQCSTPDRRKALAGSRAYYWPKDCSIQPSSIDAPASPLYAFVDVDQYVDMPYFLANNLAPVMIATVQPTACAFQANDFAFTFDEEANLHYFVSGGGTYVHPVWHYAQDTLSASKYFLGVPYATTFYSIDRRTTSPHHDIILLTPIAQWNFLATLANVFISRTPLNRYNLLHYAHNRMQIMTKEGINISTARPNQFACANVPAAVDNTIATLANTSKAGLTRAAVESHLPLPEDPSSSQLNKEMSTILHDFHTLVNSKQSIVEILTTTFTRRLSSIKTLQNMAPVDTHVKRYQYGAYDPDAKPSLVSFMQPLIHESFAPDKTRGNEQRAVDKRITAVKSDATNTPFIASAMEEFIKFLVPIPHILAPTDHDEVYDRQFRPTQRQKLDNANDLNHQIRKIVTFLKTESYTEAKEPRIISTYNDKDKLEYSRYCYAISDWFKTIPCYAFGKTPNEVSNAVVEVCRHAQTVANTDISKMDGSISPVLRELEKMLIMRLFQPAHHREVTELHAAQYNLFARTPLGIKYNSGTARGSGSPETSIFNTIVNMFSSYLAHRMTFENRTFRQPNKSWTYIIRSLYGGDDGISQDLDPPSYVKACASLGLTAKIENIQRYEFGVTFLARVYGPHVWQGDASNCADLPRQLSKLHTTVKRPQNISPSQILIDKMSGHAIVDTNTPILGEFARAAMLLNNGTYTPDPEHATWLVKSHPSSEQFNNPPCDWYMEYALKALPYFDFDKFTKWISKANSLEYLLNAPLCQEPKPYSRKEVAYVVDGDQIPPAPRLRRQTNDRPPPKPASTSPPKPTTPTITKSDNIPNSFTGTYYAGRQVRPSGRPPDPRRR